MSKPFKFKEFTVYQDRCAMKIGTDGVLLGAWASVEHNPYNVLDIGSGTGILSLMIAQRSNVEQIEAIEIDDDAFEQCVENFENSPWADRLFCFHASLMEYIEAVDEKFDIIIYANIVNYVEILHSLCYFYMISKINFVFITVDY